MPWHVRCRGDNTATLTHPTRTQSQAKTAAAGATLVLLGAMGKWGMRPAQACIQTACSSADPLPVAVMGEVWGELPVTGAPRQQSARRGSATTWSVATHRRPELERARRLRSAKKPWWYSRQPARHARWQSQGDQAHPCLWRALCKWPLRLLVISRAPALHTACCTRHAAHGV